MFETFATELETVANCGKLGKPWQVDVLLMHLGNAAAAAIKHKQ
jgi:hypothetical protein